MYIPAAGQRRLPANEKRTRGHTVVSHRGLEMRNRTVAIALATAVGLATGVSGTAARPAAGGCTTANVAFTGLGTRPFGAYKKHGVKLVYNFDAKTHRISARVSALPGHRLLCSKALVVAVKRGDYPDKLVTHGAGSAKFVAPSGMAIDSVRV